MLRFGQKQRCHTASGERIATLSLRLLACWFLALSGCEAAQGKDGQWHDLKFINGLLLVGTTSGPKNSYYVFDTGSITCALDKGYMKTQSFIDTIDGAYLPIPDAPYSTNDLGFLSDVDLAGISNAVNLKLIGVIGKRYFLEHAIQIDYEHARFREVSKETLKSGDAGEKLEMTLDHDHFYTHIDVNGEQLDKVLIDTGSTGLLTLDDKTAADLGFTSGKGQPISGGTVYGKIAGVGYRPDSIDIHGMKFDHPGIAIFPLKAGVGPKSLGNEFFSHYTVTIDGAGNAMYLKPLEKGKDSTTQPVAK